MDKYETRRLALVRLKDSLGRGAIKKIADAIDKAPDYVSRMMYPPGKAGGKRIGEESVDLLDQKFPGWLAGTSTPPPMPTAAALQKNDAEITLNRFNTGGAMGHGVELPDQPGIIESVRVSREWMQKNVRSYTAIANLSIVTGFGDSMRPMFNPGDPLIVDCGIQSVDFDAVYFFRVGNEGFIKRLQRIPTPTGLVIRAKSENPKYDHWDIIGGMDFEVFGRVLKVWRSEDF